MAVTTSAGDGVRITSPAWDGVASGTQTVCYVRINGRWAAGGNQNNGNISGCFASFVDRLVLLRRGLSNEETRYVTSCTPCAGADTTQLFVHEPWCCIPVACDTVDVSYIIQDAATVTGLGLITKRVQDYTSTRKFRVGNAGCAPAFAYFGLLNGASLETVDNSSTTCPDIRVQSNGRFSNGFLANGTGTGGGYLIGTPAAVGELVFEALCGAQLDWQDQLLLVNVNAPEVRILGSCTTGTVKMKNVFGIRELCISAPNVTYECLNLVGKGGSHEVEFNGLVCGSNVTMTNVEMDSARFNSSIISGTRTLTFNFININFKRQRDDLCTGNILQACPGGGTLTSTWNFVNPKWNPLTQSCNWSYSFLLNSSTAVVSEQFRQAVKVQTPAGTAISGAILNHISTRSATEAIRITTSSNACGDAILDTESRRWAGACETLTTSTSHALQVHSYSRNSFVTVPSLTNKVNGFGQCVSVALTPDNYVVEATEATALADGSTKITICGPATNPHSIIKYTCGTGTLTVGAVLQQCFASGIPSGTVKEIIEGDSTSGTVVLTGRDANNFANTCTCLNEVGGGGCWSGQYVACSQQCFSWLMCAGQISCVDRTAQQLYDSNKAKLHQCPIDTVDNWDDVKIWGGSDFAHPLQGVSGAGTASVKFKTVKGCNVIPLAVQQLTGCNTSSLTATAGCVLPTVVNRITTCNVSKYVGVGRIGVWLKKSGTPTGKIRGVASGSCNSCNSPNRTSTNSICIGTDVSTTYTRFCFRFCPPIAAVDLVGCCGGDIGIQVFCTHSLTSCNRLDIERNNTNSTCDYAGFLANGGCCVYTALPSSSEAKMKFNDNKTGWVITGLNNLGQISSFTDDCGNAFNPASSVPITITVKDCTGTVVNGMRVGVFTQPRCPGDTALACGTTNACGVFNTNIIVGGDVNVDLVARRKGYINNTSGQVVDSCNGLVTGITVIKDTIVNLP